MNLFYIFHSLIKSRLGDFIRSIYSASQIYEYIARDFIMLYSQKSNAAEKRIYCINGCPGLLNTLHKIKKSFLRIIKNCMTLQWYSLFFTFVKFFFRKHLISYACPKFAKKKLMCSKKNKYFEKKTQNLNLFKWMV